MSNTNSHLIDLTGSAPTPFTTTTAGLLHTWKLETQYYRADLTIWIDEIVDKEAWQTEFMKPEAKEVVSALGAWIYCFRKPLGGEELVRLSVHQLEGCVH